jgi:O-antigen/teichoic acid export membrane protein
MRGMPPLVRRLVLVQALDVVTVFSFFLFVRFVNVTFGAEAVGIYAVIRRVMGIGIPLLSLGLNESLPYSVASSRDSTSLSAAILGAIAIVLAMALVVTAGAIVFDADSARLVFGNYDLAAYSVSGAALLSTTAGAAIIGSVFRGLGDFSTFGGIQLIAVALCPFLALAISSSSLHTVLLLMAGIAGVAAIAGCVRLAMILPPVNASTLWNGTRAYLRTSLFRLPGVLLIGAMPLIIVLFATDSIGLVRTGYLAVAISIVMALGGVASSFGVSALPALTASWKSGREQETTHVVINALSATTAVMVFAAGAFYVGANHVAAFLFPNAQGVSHVFRLSAVLIPLIGMGSVFRYVLDAISDRAYNSRILSVSTATATICLVGLHYHGLVPNEALFLGAYVAAELVLIGLSIVYCANEGLKVFRGATDIAKSAVASSGAAGFLILVGGDGLSVQALGGVLLLGMLLLLFLLRALHVDWLRTIFRKSLSRI